MFKGLRVSRPTRLFRREWSRRRSSKWSRLKFLCQTFPSVYYRYITLFLSLHSHTNKLISADRCSRWLNVQYVCVDTRETRGYFSPRYLLLLEPDNLARLISGGAGGERVQGGLGRAYSWNSICPKAAPSPYLHHMFLYLMKFSKIGTRARTSTVWRCHRPFSADSESSGAWPWRCPGYHMDHLVWAGITALPAPRPIPSLPTKKWDWIFRVGHVESRKDTRWITVRRV